MKVFKGKVKIHKSAIDFYNGEQEENSVEKAEFLVDNEVDKGDKVESSIPGEQEEKKDTSKDEKDEMISFLKQEIQFKNEQIETLQEQLTNSQRLLAMEKQEKQALLNSGRVEKADQEQKKIGIFGHIKKLFFNSSNEKAE